MAKEEWKNLGYELYKEWKGEDVFNEKMEEAQKDLPTPGLFSEAQLKLNIIQLKTIFGLQAFKTRKRATHPNGFGVLGKATIVSSPQFPEHEFFVPNRTFPVRLRHANLLSEDDATSDYRGAALKFADTDDESPLDIIMSTGRGGPLFNVETIWHPIVSKWGGGSFKDYVLLSPDHLFINIDGLRRAPDSYTDQVYHSQVALNYKAKDGRARYVKFRLINAEGRAETGLLTEQEQRKVWERERHLEEKRSKHYLREEFAERLSKGTINYKLQLQLHLVSSLDRPHVLHCGWHWDEETHPWIDLADVTITTMIPPNVIERTQFNIGNLPPSLEFVGPPESVHDFRCVPYIRKEVYKRSQTMRKLMVTEQKPENVSVYHVHIERAKKNDAAISITLTGSHGRTDALVMEKVSQGDLEDTYRVEGMDVGKVYIIQLHNLHNCGISAPPKVFIKRITILKEGTEIPYVFLCYMWLQNDLIAFEGPGLLPQKEQPEVVRFYRHLQLQEHKKNYRWNNNIELLHFPGCIDAKTHNDIPINSQFSNPAMKSFKTGQLNAVMNLGIVYLTTLMENWADFDDFKKMYTDWCVKDKPKYSEGDIWTEDRVFGMQFLNGVNPMMIQRCEKLPTGFPVTQDLVADCLDRGLTLEEEIKAGHVYVASYSLLEGIRRNGQGTSKIRYITEPIVLLYVKTSGDLVPIAIQLFQQSSPENPIWTPNDEKLDWLFAKIWVKAADLQVHQMITHLLRTHLVIECFAVAAWRNLPSLHPVFKLLFPHIKSVMAINTLGRKELIARGGISDVTLSIGGGGHIEIIEKFYKSFTWDMMDIPRDLERRGLLDEKKLPNFYYRQDALSLWKAISDFIRDIIGVYYHTEEDVKEDTELQAWVKDIHDNGIAPTPGHVDHQFPASLTSRDQLIHLLTCVVFTCTCQHAAVNFSQLEAYAFIPNAPPTMQLPPPTRKGETNMKRIMGTLPTKWQTSWHIGLMHTLTRFVDDEKFLGDYSDGLFVNHKAHKAISDFQDQLQKISDDIKERNKLLDWPYIYLLPEKIPNSVAI